MDFSQWKTRFKTLTMNNNSKNYHNNNRNNYHNNNHNHIHIHNNNNHHDSFSAPSERSQSSLLDQPIKNTADDAMVAKLATTHAGYYSDPFLDAFCRSPEDDGPGGSGRWTGASRSGGVSMPNGRRRIVQPLIKRGTHARVCVMDRVVSVFLKKQLRKVESESETESKTETEGETGTETEGEIRNAKAERAACQIVVLGAGKDTSYFRYRNGDLMGMEPFREQQQKTTATKTKTTTATATATATIDPPTVHWYEVDHFSVVKEKAALIRKSNLLKSYCPMLVKTGVGYESVTQGTSLGLRTFGAAQASVSVSSSSSSSSSSLSSSSSSSSSTYHLIGHDLRDSPQLLLEKLDLNPKLPTLFLMECVSMYVPIEASKNLLQAVSVSADTVCIACYEPILGSNNTININVNVNININDKEDSSSPSSPPPPPSPWAERKRVDPFGKVMEDNLVKMRVASPDSCLLQTRTLRDQLEKLTSCEGFVRAVGCDMWSAYETIVTDAQRRRANQSEFMDEFEEWILIMKHYCFVVAEGGRSISESLSESVPSSSPGGGGDERHGLGLTVIPGPDSTEQERLSSVGWVAGKCTELENKTE
eukprot:CAMPEP_0172377684 /NCGR_PEP_ID=MMETSP1060-20121228/69031_1 /TAXON_ID=37318 /ORGANISM="Pseudo-nitzschia pungens, Strain cf. cingulata" /LENGTH=591 /DNA_ID=CAMNT_0013105387 /DNA_START=141 /DNA_END=1916 /DNA_ORIENTATION=+